MDQNLRDTLNSFLAQYDTLAIATDDEGQPYVTRVFFVEEPLGEASTTLKLYGTFITTSRKLSNLRANPRVGLFIGPSQPSNWLEGTALAHVVDDEKAQARIRTNLERKSAVAAGFIARVPIATVELEVTWLRITNLTATPPQIELAFPPKPARS